MLDLTRAMWLTSWTAEIKNCPLMGRGGKLKGVKDAAATTLSKRQDLVDQRWRRQKVLNFPLEAPARWLETPGKPRCQGHGEHEECDCFFEGEIGTDG